MCGQIDIKKLHITGILFFCDNSQDVLWSEFEIGVSQMHVIYDTASFNLPGLPKCCPDFSCVVQNCRRVRQKISLHRTKIS